MIKSLFLFSFCVCFSTQKVSDLKKENSGNVIDRTLGNVNFPNKGKAILLVESDTVKAVDNSEFNITVELQKSKNWSSEHLLVILLQFFPSIFQLNICRCHGSALAALSRPQLEPRRIYCLLQITTTKHSAFRAISMGCTLSGSSAMRLRLERNYTDGFLQILSIHLNHLLKPYCHPFQFSTSLDFTV